jgi:hypothetical protein
MIALLAALVLQAQPPPAPKADPKAPAPLEAEVTAVKGTVDVKRPGDKDWVPAAKGMMLKAGSELCTGLASTCTLVFLGNVQVEVKPLTEASIEDLVKVEGAGKADVKLKFGTLKVDVQKGDLRSDLKISAPNSTTSVSGSSGFVHAPASGGGVGIVTLLVLSGTWMHGAAGVDKGISGEGVADNAGNQARDLRFREAMQLFLDFGGHSAEELYRGRFAGKSGDFNPWEFPFAEWAGTGPASPKHKKAAALPLPPPTPPGP